MQTKLFVKAVENADVVELDENGSTIRKQNQIRRVVGKSYNEKTNKYEVIEAGVFVPYLPAYIKHLKDKSLLPNDFKTANLAGVSLV